MDRRGPQDLLIVPLRQELKEVRWLVQVLTRARLALKLQVHRFVAHVRARSQRGVVDLAAICESRPIYLQVVLV